MAKTCFKEWLWDLPCAEIKHIYSDNDVLIIHAFHANCITKHQYLSFSGVVVHHQNAHAEHAIQTIVYMARTFMLHISFHWSEYDVDE